MESGRDLSEQSFVASVRNSSVECIFRYCVKPLSHQGGVLTATARRARKTQNAEVRAVRSPRAPRDRRGISTGRRGVS